MATTLPDLFTRIYAVGWDRYHPKADLWKVKALLDMLWRFPDKFDNPLQFAVARTLHQRLVRWPSQPQFDQDTAFPLAEAQPGWVFIKDIHPQPFSAGYRNTGTTLLAQSNGAFLDPGQQAAPSRFPYPSPQPSPAHREGFATSSFYDPSQSPATHQARQGSLPPRHPQRPPALGPLDHSNGIATDLGCPQEAGTSALPPMTHMRSGNLSEYLNANSFPLQMDSPQDSTDTSPPQQAGLSSASWPALPKQTAPASLGHELTTSPDILTPPSATHPAGQGTPQLLQPQPSRAPYLGILQSSSLDPISPQQAGLSTTPLPPPRPQLTTPMDTAASLDHSSGTSTPGQWHPVQNPQNMLTYQQACHSNFVQPLVSHQPAPPNFGFIPTIPAEPTSTFEQSLSAPENCGFTNTTLQSTPTFPTFEQLCQSPHLPTNFGDIDASSSDHDFVGETIDPRRLSLPTLGSQNLAAQPQTTTRSTFVQQPTSAHHSTPAVHCDDTAATASSSSFPPPQSSSSTTTPIETGQPLQLAYSAREHTVQSLSASHPSLPPLRKAVPVDITTTATSTSKVKKSQSTTKNNKKRKSPTDHDDDNTSTTATSMSTSKVEKQPKSTKKKRQATTDDDDDTTEERRTKKRQPGYVYKRLWL